jgi:large subunit ribosomal protein L10
MSFSRRGSMDNPRPEKVAVVDEVRERLSSSSAALLTEYRGLKVGELADLRRALRTAGGDYKIYKNTLVRFAVRDLELEGVEELLTGPTAIAFVEGDAAAVAKALRDFARINPNLVVKGGILGGSALSPDAARALAELPPREVLLARLAGGLAAPLVQLAGLLQALPRNLAYGLKALLDQQGGAPEAVPPAPEEPTPEPEPSAAAEPEPEPTVAADPEPEPAEAAADEAETEAAEAVAPGAADVIDTPTEPDTTQET